MARKYTDSSISTIGGLQHMRKHSGMWSFDRDSQQGLYQMVKEVFDNAIDEASVDPGNLHTIDVTFLRWGSTFQCIIEDTGRGVPLKKLHDSFMELFTSAKDEEAYNKSIGTYGVGVKATTALSRKLCAVSRRGEGSAIITTHQGECIHRKVVKKSDKEITKFGTTVLLEPDTTIITQAKHFFDDKGGFYDFTNLIEFVCMLYKNVNVNIYIGKGRLVDDNLVGNPLDVLRVLKSAKQNCKLEYVSENTTTPVEYLRKKNGITSPTIWESPIFKDSVDSSTSYHVQFFLTKDYTTRNGQIVSSINAIQMHDKKAVQVQGVIEAIKGRLAEYIEDKELRSFFTSSYTLPMHLITLAWNDKASFENQGKTSYKDRKFLDTYTKALTKQFKTLDPSFWDGLFTLLSEDIEAKYHKHNTKGMDVGGSMKNLAYRLNKPSSFCPCRCKDQDMIEVFFVEGDSAMTTIKQVCDREYQAIFAIDGKPMNPFKKDTRTVMKNTTHQDMIRIIGVSPGDKNLDNMNFSRIGILADADLTMI